MKKERKRERERARMDERNSRDAKYIVKPESLLVLCGAVPGRWPIESVETSV